MYRIDLDNPNTRATWISAPFRCQGEFRPRQGPPGKSDRADQQSQSRAHRRVRTRHRHGELTLLAENPGNVITPGCAPNGDLFTNTLTADGDVGLSQWDSATASLRSIKVYDGTDYPLGIFPLVISPDGSGIWLGSNEGSDRTRLARLDVATGEKTEVDNHPTFDLGNQDGVTITVHPQASARGN